MKRVMLFFLGVFVCVTASLQGEENYTRFERISAEEGFSQGVVNTIVQDGRGFMWFGTQGGLYRFNGYKFTVFKYNPRDPLSLPVNKVPVILESRNKTLWIGTEGGGLICFNRSKENFDRYEYNNPTDLHQEPGISNIRCILEGSNGIIWLGTAGGLLRFDPVKKTWRRFYNGLEDPWGLSNNQVNTLCEDNMGLLWVGTQGGGVNVLDAAKNTFVTVPNLPNEKNSAMGKNVRSIVRDKKEQMWIGTETGLFRYDLETRHFFSYQNSAVNSDSLGDNQVRTLFVDSKNDLWVGTRHGLDRIKSLQEGIFAHYHNQPDKPNSLSHNWVEALYEDRAGSLWIGTFGGGINRIDRQKQQFGHFLGNTTDRNSLSSNEITAFFRDNKGVLWIGTYDKGLNLLDGETGVFTHYKYSKSDPTSLSSDELAAIYQDIRGDMWIGTWGGGVNRWVAGTKGVRFIRYMSDENNVTGPSSNKIFCFSEDLDGNVWIGTLGGGLNRFLPEKGKHGEFLYYLNNSSVPTSISSNHVTVICPDLKDKSILWLGMNSSGLDCFNRNTGIFGHYTNIPGDPNSLSHNTVRALYISPSQPGVIWIGTFGGGLNRFDQEKNQWKVYTEDDRLSDNTIYGILEDDSGFLWMSTNKGLSRFDPRVEQFVNYDVNDGLQGNEFSQGAFHKGNDGRLYFGGLNGYNVFDPKRIERNPYLPPVVITEFKIFNSKATLSQSIVETKEIHLNYWDSVFSFEFAALNYIGTAKNQYAYRMGGEDDRWIQLNDKREITFSRISPGEYNFQVKGSNNDGVWNETGASITLFVAPPFWGTWWFRIVAFVAMMAGILLIYKLRVRKYKRQREKLRLDVMNATQEIREQNKIIEDKSRQLESSNQDLLNSAIEISLQNKIIEDKNKLLEISNQDLKKSEENLIELNATKDKFFSIISHDMKNYLTSLMGASYMLANEYKNMKEEQRVTYSQAIDKFVNQLNDLLVNLLQWARSQTGKLTCKPKKILLSDIVAEAISLHATHAKKKEIELVPEILGEPMAFADKDMVTFILRNLISNAIKFTEPGGLIRLIVLAREELSEVSVIDNGVGISPAKVETLFKVGLNESTKGTANEKGNGLGLVLCKEFVEKNGGNIWYEVPETNKGCIFRFTLAKAEKKNVTRRLG